MAKNFVNMKFIIELTSTSNVESCMLNNKLEEIKNTIQKRL